TEDDHSRPRLPTQRAGRRAGPTDLGGGPRTGRPGGPDGPAERASGDRRARDPRRVAVLARGARLRTGRRRGPDRPSLPGTAVLVPADGRTAAAAEPDPYRCLRAGRAGGGPRGRSACGRWPPGE